MAVDQKQSEQLLRDLVAIDSVNPSLVPGVRGEADAANFVRAWLAKRGIEAQVQEASDDARMSRPNVVARIGGSAREKPALMLVAHIDTVGAGDMPDAFTPREKDGRLYGRGALDIKSGVAVICSVAAALAAEGARLRRPLLIAAVVDEECNSLGAQKLVQEHAADAAVVLEPTDMKLCVAHKGYAWLRVTTQGRAAHGSRPDEGRDAIAHMGRVLREMEKWDAELAARARHPLLGRASVHASLIGGGHELSSYPAQCELQIERRTLPGEQDEQVAGECAAIVQKLAAEDEAFHGATELFSSRAAYEIAADSPIAQAAARAVRGVAGDCTVAGASFWTDTAILAAAGIPGVVFGPRGEGLHAANEYVELASVTQCAEAMRALALELCSS